MASESKVAIVTGASRGIGRGCALALARRGFDVVLCARTVQEGSAFEHSMTVKKSDMSPLPGSLERTAEEVKALGQRALISRLDLLDRSHVDTTIEATLKEFGRIDVLVNNGRYIGPGHMDLFLDTPIEIFDQQFDCNVLTPLYFISRVAPIMAEQGGGVVIQITSGAGHNETANLPGQGGWGLGYSLTKAAFNRMAAGLGKELKSLNIAVINLEPGFVATERTKKDLKEFGLNPDIGLDVDVPGEACAYLASHPQPMFFSGRDVDGPGLVLEVGLATGEDFPPAYGPAGWGLPKGSPI